MKPELLSLRGVMSKNSRELRDLERLRAAWPLMVGSGLSNTTHPVSLAHGLLLIGCHDAYVLKSMRASVQETWPILQQRVNAYLGAHLQRVEITPADPLPPAPSPPEKQPVSDPLKAVLEFYRGQGRGTRGQ